MKLDCQMCGKTTVLSDAKRTRIVANLAEQGPAAAYIWNCACGRFQIVPRRVAPLRPVPQSETKSGLPPESRPIEVLS
jgi:hypothetical protein